MGQALEMCVTCENKRGCDTCTDLHNWIMEHQNSENRGMWEEVDWVRVNQHGEFVHYPKEGLRCSNCCNAFKKDLLWKDNYCPNCGAKMIGRVNK